MKLAVVADIHANLPALRRFLEIIEEENIETVLNLGDTLQIGPHPSEVLRLVLSDNRFINIAGNNDIVLFDRDLYKGRIEMPRDEIEHQEWTIKEVGEEGIRRVEKMDRMKEFILNGVKTLLVHSRINDCIAPPLIYEDKTLKEMRSDYGDGYGIVLFGHTHKRLLIEDEHGLMFLNPGSLGCDKEGKGSFCIMDIEEKVQVAFRSADFSRRVIHEDLRKRNVPAHERIIRSFY
jgi:putative phosphoesterase